MRNWRERHQNNKFMSTVPDFVSEVCLLRDLVPERGVEVGVQPGVDPVHTVNLGADLGRRTRAMRRRRATGKEEEGGGGTGGGGPGDGGGAEGAG